MILRDPDGTWRCQGWPYEIIGKFVEQIGREERGFLSNYCTLIRSFREHLKAAPKAEPARLVVRIDRQLATERWHREQIEAAAALPGASTDGDIVTVPFSTANEYLLTHQPRAAATWRVLDLGELPAQAMASQTPAA